MEKERKKFNYADLKRTKSSLEPWFPYKPLVNRLTLFFANYTSLTSNQITMIAFLFSLVSAWFFLDNNLIIAAVLFQIRYILDYTDGWTGRLKGMVSKRGAYLDNWTGRISLLLNSFGLFYGQYLISKDIIWMILLPLLIFTYTLRSWEAVKVKDIINDTNL